jgi:hypothetical protein
MASNGLIRLEPNGPGGVGLQPLALDPADFLSDLPRQGYHVYFEDAAIGLTVGVWETTSMQEAFGPYPGDEFIVVLDGAFAMIDGSGRGTPAHARQAVAFRNGAPMSWMQAGYLKKFYLVLSDPRAPRPSLADAGGAVVVTDPSVMLSGDDEPDSSWPAASGRERVVFVNDAGTMRVAVRRTDRTSNAALPSPNHRFVYLLDGRLTVETADRGSIQLAGGDVFFISQGTVLSWHGDGPLLLVDARVEGAQHA